MNRLPFLVNGLVVVKNQAQAQVINQTRNSPPAPTWDHHQIRLMAQGMENDVSDDDSDSPSYEELLELVHEYQKVIKKQLNEIENLNALNDFNAIFATNY